MVLFGFVTLRFSRKDLSKVVSLLRKERKYFSLGSPFGRQPLNFFTIIFYNTIIIYFDHLVSTGSVFFEAPKNFFI